jgi:hypothetical protein
MRTALVATLVAGALTACAAPLTGGQSGGLAWRVAELQTSERPATQPGYKDGGRSIVYRYVVVLTDTRGVGVDFREVESIVLNGPGFRATPTKRAVTVRVPPNGQARVAMADSTWLVVPQWFEGAERPVNLNPVAKKVFRGTDDRRQPVTLAIEFLLDRIPPLMAWIPRG